MRWGFNWQIGPFETWDALSLPESTQQMQADGLNVPEWVTKLADQNGSFYKQEGDSLLQATPQSTYIPVEH